MGVEPTTFWLATRCSTTELRSHLTSRHIRPAQLDGHLSSLTAVLVCISLYAVPGMFHTVLSKLWSV
jgi:hypothetical protein